MSEPGLGDKVVAVHRGLAGAHIPHAFGGAIALGYYAEPRATIDIDVNVFAGVGEWQSVAAALTPLGVDVTTDPGAIERDGWIRWWWGRTAVEVFFAYDEFHDAMRAAARTYPFGDASLPVLAPEHLAACKAVFDRTKDWVDLEGLLGGAEGFSTAEARRWLDRIVGAEDQRRRRFDELAATILGE